jgi:tetratricopeptide (TPR) repeat protein
VQARRDKYLARGRAFQQKHDYSRAILEYRNAMRIMPKDPQPVYEIGMALQEAGDYRNALALFQKAISLDPKFSPAQLKIAEMMALSDDPAMVKEARNKLKQLFDEGNKTAETVNSLAFTELKLGEPGSATQRLEKLLAESPGEFTTAVVLARARLEQHDVKGAQAVLEKLCQDVPKSGDAPRLLAEFFIDQNRMADAEPQLRKALELDPKNGPALLDLARLLLATGRKPEAEQDFRQVSKLEDYKLVYGLFLFQDGRHEDAIQEFQRLAKANPENRTVRTYLVQAYQLSRKPAEAENVLAQALKRNPRDSDALLQHAEVLIQKGDYGQAEMDLNRVLHVKPNAPEAHYVAAKLQQARGNRLTYRQELSEALRLDPALLLVRLELAQNLTAGKEERAARDILDAAPQFQKASPAWLAERNWALWSMGDMAEMRQGIDRGLAAQKSADFLIQDGLWKLKVGNPTGARAALEEALKLDPSDLRALAALNQTYVAQKNAPAALQKVKEYAAGKRSAPVQQFLGLMLMANGDRQGARTAFVTAKAADPQFLAADLSLVQIDVAEGHLDHAKATLESVLAKDAGNMTARQWLGNIKVMQGNEAAAIDDFEKVVAASPDPQAANNLAYLLAEYRNQTDEALKLAQKAVEVAPTNASYSDTLGWVLYKKGLYNNAIPYFQRASADPENVVWKYHLAMAYAKAGDTKRGRSILEAALKVDSRVPEARMAKAVVEQAQSR